MMMMMKVIDVCRMNVMSDGGCSSDMYVASVAEGDSDDEVVGSW